MLRIVTDGSADMPEGWQREYDIDIVPIPIQFGNRTFLQGVDLSNEAFYRLVRETGMIPKTSLPSPSLFSQTYQKIAGPGDTILSIHVSSKMSGTFSAALIAARELVDQYKIIPVDSGSGSAALGFMCREARLMERNGAPLQSILNRLDFMRQNISIVMALDSLDFARMSGRVSALKAAIASLLSVKPIVVLKDGLLGMAEKVRTRGKSLDRVVEIARQCAVDKQVNVAIVHCQDPQAGKTLGQQVKTVLNCRELIMTELSISVAANLGPGTVGIVVYPSG
ncbi:MAG TPA: DegV family protein [Anaerolineales bacterium]|nr:DegV family protein [Anaerolineales bacterium]